MKQSKDNKNLLNELRGLLDNNANILERVHIKIESKIKARVTIER